MSDWKYWGARSCPWADAIGQRTVRTEQMTAHCNTERRVNQRSLTERPPRKPESLACQDQFEFLGVEYTPARFPLERLQFDIHRIAPPENPKGRLHRDAGGTILFAR